MSGTVKPYDTKQGTRYRVRYRKPDGKQTDKRGFRTIRDANLFLSTVNVNKADGSYVDPAKGKITVEQIGTRWLDGQAHLKPSTLHSVESNWRIHVKPMWGNRTVSSIDHSEIQDWVTLLTKGNDDDMKPKSATTVKRCHGILSAILERAALDRRIPANPAKGVKLPRKTGKERAYLSHAQVTALATEAKANAGLVYLLAYTGLRWGEATGLRVKDVNFIRGRITVESNAVSVNGKVKVGTPKTHRARWVPFSEFLREPLTEAAQDKDREQLLFGDGHSHMLPPNSVNGWFAQAVKRCMQKDKLFPRVTPHDLRHTTASLSIAAGANVKAIQRMLGHASAAMTLDVYGDLFDDDLEAVAAALDLKRGQSVGKTA